MALALRVTTRAGSRTSVSAARCPPRHAFRHCHKCHKCNGCPSCRRLTVRAAATATKQETNSDQKKDDKDGKSVELQYLSQRMADITAHFPSAMGVDDFLMRVEVALCAHGFRGDNSIACTNLCRDESTGIFKTKIDSVFGHSFNINGLGACLTCGCLGFKAGFSHAPNLDGKERYVFFSFPHIAVDSEGQLGNISRPGRAGNSSACGALIASLGQFQSDPQTMSQYSEGKHDPDDPEFAILKQKLAARIKKERLDVNEMNIVDMTLLAERAISADLQHLIKETVDTKAADYAVVTGVHIHNWGNEGTGAPTLEWIAPSSMYVVNSGKRTNINLEAVPAMTPRQLALLQDAHMPPLAAGFTGYTTVVESKLTDPAAGPMLSV